MNEERTQNRSQQLFKELVSRLAIANRASQTIEYRIWGAILDEFCECPEFALRHLKPLEAIIQAQLNDRSWDDEPKTNRLIALMLDLRVVQEIIRLKRGGAADDLPGKREDIVKALLVYSEYRRNGMSSAVLRDHFARLVEPPTNLTTTLVAQQTDRPLRTALLKVTPNNFQHFLALARKHVRFVLLDWVRGKWLRRPGVTDPQGFAMSSYAARDQPDEIAEFKELIEERLKKLTSGDPTQTDAKILECFEEAVAKLSPEEQQLFDAFWDTAQELQDIANDYFGGNLDLASAKRSQLFGKLFRQVRRCLHRSE